MAKSWINKDRFKKTQKQAEKEAEGSSGSQRDIFPYGMKSTQKGKQIEPGKYVLRFLPATKDEYPEDFYRVVHFHLFHTPDGWKYFQCLQTTGEKCPICEVSKQLFIGDQQDKKEAKRLYRQEKRIANVYVVDDPRDSQRVKEDHLTGTVRLLEYKTQLNQKISKAMSNDEETGLGAGVIDPSDEGHNFILQVTEKVSVDEESGKESRYPSYEESMFSLKASPLADSDEEIEKILGDVFSLENKLKDQAPGRDEMYEILDKMGLLEVAKETETDNTPKTEKRSTKTAKEKTKKEQTKKEKPEPEEDKTSSDDSFLDEDDQKFLNDLSMDGPDDDIPF
jgi:hypothetical protein